MLFGLHFMSLFTLYNVVHNTRAILTFLPRCMECRRALAMIILSISLSVCLSVRQSVKRVDCDKTKEKSVQIFIPYEN